MMLEATKKFEVVFIRLEEINLKYLSYFEVDLFDEISFYIYGSL